MKNVKSNVDKESLNIGWWSVVAFACVVILWLVNCFWLPCCSTAERRGQFGDKFGAVNALFSGLAFAGLIITLVMQYYELRLQRKGMADQAREMNNQRFENSLFNMLSMQQNIVCNFSLNINKEVKGGDELFYYLYHKVELTDSTTGNNIEGGVKRLVVQNIKDYYLFEWRYPMIDCYFRHLYHIFKYIDESSLIDEDDKYDYACIVSVQLSKYELLMLFYNALNDGKFKRLIEKYAIFNNLCVGELAKKEHKDLYAEGAYEYKKED